MKLEQEIYKLKDSNISKEAIYLELLKKDYKVEELNKYFSGKKRLDSSEETQKRTIHIVVSIGAIFIGAGVFSFIASNWQEISSFLKVIIILISMICSYSLGYLIESKYSLSKTSNALYLLGLIIYGSGIFLVAQIFNISANWPDGFILWMIGSFVMAILLESRFYTFIGLLLGFVSLAGYPFIIMQAIGHGNPTLVVSTGLLFIATVLVGIISIYIHKEARKNIIGHY